MRCLPLLITTAVATLLSASAAIATVKMTPPPLFSAQNTANHPKKAADQQLKIFQTSPYMATQHDLAQLRSTYQTLGDQDGVIAVDLESVLLDYHNGEYEVAQQRLNRIPPSQQKLLKVKRANTQGFLLLEAGDYGNALLQFNQASLHGYTDLIEMARTHAGIGTSYRYIGRYQEAIDRLLMVRGNRDAVLYASAMALIADIEVEIGQEKLAASHYEEAIDVLNRSPYRGRRSIELAKTLAKSAKLLHRQGEKAKAASAIATATQLLKALGRPELTQAAVTELGWYYLLEQPELARAHFEASNAAAKNRASYIAKNYFGLAKYHQQKGAIAEATAAYEKAWQYLGKRRDLPMVQLLNDYGKFAAQQGQNKKAIELLNWAISGYEALRPGMSDEFKVTAGDSQIQPYQTLQRAQIAEGDIEGALITAERGRARAFAELLVRRSRRQVKPVTYSRKQTPTGEVTTLTIEVERPPVVPVPTIAEIKQVAKQQKATLVTYSILNDPQTNQQTELYIWVITPQGEIQFRRIDLRQLSRASSLKQIAEKSRITDSSYMTGESVGELLVAMRGTSRGKIRSARSIENPPATHPTLLRQTANNAYRLLIQPIADLLPPNVDDRVILIPQGALFNVPFHALQDNQGKYLLERHTLQIAPSIQSLALVKKRSTANMKPLIIGNPKPMPESLDPLPGAEQEAKNIGLLFNTNPLIGDAATEVDVTKRLTQASVIHLATHGLMDDENGMDSAIALVPGRGADGLLSAREIFDLRLNADLAVLSACNTGQGKVTGDGVIGLSRSLMSAGVPSVVVSLWAVPDEPTQVLMTEFYRQLQQRPDKSQALRQAMLKTMQQYPDPGDWAGFVLIGSAD